MRRDAERLRGSTTSCGQVILGGGAPTLDCWRAMKYNVGLPSLPLMPKDNSNNNSTNSTNFDSEQTHPT